jgi:uncharacterized protein YuzE
MATLKFEEPRSVRRDYDAEADVLYIYFGESRPCLTLDLGEGILAHYVEESGELIGFTILFASERFESEATAIKASGRPPTSLK